MAEIEEAATRRSGTAQLHRQAVERTIRRMDQQLYENLMLKDMAAIGIMSPHHFNRVFRSVTGVPPARFLTARRMEAAKRLLVDTGLRITDICFEVGYNSLGTFTRRFGELVGVTPRHFRRLAEDRSRHRVRDLAATALRPSPARADAAAPAEAAITGRVSTAVRFEGTVVVGLFPTVIPQGRPTACCVALAPGRFAIRNVPDGAHYLYAVALPDDPQPHHLLLFEDALRGGAREQPVRVRNGRCESEVEVVLHRPQVIDRPILLTLPPLIEEWLASRAARAGQAEAPPAEA